MWNTWQWQYLFLSATVMCTDWKQMKGNVSYYIDFACKVLGKSGNHVTNRKTVILIFINPYFPVCLIMYYYTLTTIMIKVCVCLYSKTDYIVIWLFINGWRTDAPWTPAPRIYAPLWQMPPRTDASQDKSPRPQLVDGGTSFNANVMAHSVVCYGLLCR